MAATRLIPLHINKGKTVARCLADRTAYSENAEKTNDGEFISAYGCDPKTADEEFLLSKRKYEQSNGRRQKRDVIAYQIRQSFKPGEITPEKANEIGYELAMRFTKGKHAFMVATHIDKAHIHNHIIFNSTTMDGHRKFRNFFLSSFVIQRISDMLCVENNLSIIEKPKREKKSEKQKAEKERRFGMLIDVEKKLAEGKGNGYAMWAKRYNIKQISKAIVFLKENHVESQEDLKRIVNEKSERYENIKSSIQAADKRMDELSELRTHLINYGKTKEIYVEYRKHGYSKSFFEAHREELTVHKAAKAFLNNYKGTVPRMKDISAEFAELRKKKSEYYAELKPLQKEYREFQMAQEILKTVLNDDQQNRSVSKKRAAITK